MRVPSLFLLCAIALPLAGGGVLKANAQAPAAEAAQALPAHVLVGYWQNFTTEGTVAQTLAQVPAAYTVVEVAFANPDRAVDGGVSFDLDPQLARTIPGGYSAARFSDDVKMLHGQGRYVLLSVGGQHRSFALTTDAMAAKFAESAYAQMRRYGFDGIDIDLENVINADNYRYLEEALRKLRAKAGAKLMITLAPQTNDMLPANPALDNYLKIAVDLGDTITMVNTQYYNSGTKRGRDGKVYTCGTVDFITALTDAMLQSVSADKLGIGLPATAKDRGYMEPALVNAALDCLTAGTHCGAYVPAAKYPGLRGAMFWSTNWDAATGNRFSTEVGAHLKTLGK